MDAQASPNPQYFEFSWKKQASGFRWTGINLLHDSLFPFCVCFLSRICKIQPETWLNYSIGKKKIPLMPVMMEFYITWAGECSFKLMMGQRARSRSWMETSKSHFTSCRSPNKQQMGMSWRWTLIPSSLQSPPTRGVCKGTLWLRQCIGQEVC